ncbi:MAG TPA: hypothetical protein VFZ65_16655 [Planctomycetota bacterium]|nr:hypothetical protein [Planctomycetota bacterium]
MHPSHSFAVLALACSASAQDMVAVSWSGDVYALDSFTGAVGWLGMGLPGQNASARDDHGRLWSTANGGGLTILDPSPVSTSHPLPGFTADLRALANGGGQFLVGIENGPVDMLVRIDKLSGAKTIIGATGFANIEALDNHNYHLYAWDTVAGLLQVDPATGAAFDVNPAIGAGVQIEWLSTRSDGKLVGGRNSLYVIDVTTGATSLIANLGALDLRGADAWQSAAHSFGTGCHGVFGVVGLTATVTPQTLSLHSTNHAPNAPGVAIFGLSKTAHGGSPLPLSMDPFLGTVGCSLLTSWHASVPGVTNASGPASLDFQFPIPPLNDLYSFFVQHVVVEPVTGGLSMSNGMVVQVGH